MLAIGARLMKLSILLYALTGLAMSLAVTTRPDMDDSHLGLVFDPDLSRADIVRILSATDAAIVAFGPVEFIAVVAPVDMRAFWDRLPDGVWLSFRPEGLRPCGETGQGPAFATLFPVEVRLA